MDSGEQGPGSEPSTTCLRPVIQDNVGSLQQAHGSQGEQLHVAGPCTDQMNLSRAACWAQSVESNVSFILKQHADR